MRRLSYEAIGEAYLAGYLAKRGSNKQRAGHRAIAQEALRYTLQQVVELLETRLMLKGEILYGSGKTITDALLTIIGELKKTVFEENK